MSCHLKDGDCRITLKTMKLRNQMGESCDGEAVGCGEDLCQIIVQAGELSLDLLIAETG